MAKGVAANKGVFCLETDQWFRQKDRSSVEPVLRLVERFCKTRYEHRDVATEGEFKFFMDKYLVPGYDNFPILYLVFHGRCAEDDEDAFVEIGDGTKVSHWAPRAVDGRSMSRAGGLLRGVRGHGHPRQQIEQIR